MVSQPRSSQPVPRAGDGAVAMATLLLWWLQMLQPSSSTCPILAPCPCQEGTCSGDEGDRPFSILAGRRLSCCPWHVL